MISFLFTVYALLSIASADILLKTGKIEIGSEVLCLFSHTRLFTIPPLTINMCSRRTLATCSQMCSTSQFRITSTYWPSVMLAKRNSWLHSRCGPATITFFSLFPDSNTTYSSFFSSFPASRHIGSQGGRCSSHGSRAE